MKRFESSYKRHRFPAEIIQHAVWLYYRFNLSSGDTETYSPKSNSDNYGGSNEVRPMIIVKLGGCEGKNLSEDQNRTLEQAKDELQKLYRNA
jgi:hypothetical protein